MITMQQCNLVIYFLKLRTRVHEFLFFVVRLLGGFCVQSLPFGRLDICFLKRTYALVCIFVFRCQNVQAS